MMPCKPAAPMHLCVPTALPSLLPEGLQHPSPAESIGDSPGGGGRREEGALKKQTRKNYSTHYQIHLPVQKQLPHSSLLFGQPHTIQNKARCWRLRTINNSKVCAAAGGRTARGGAPQGWHKEWICSRLPAKCTGKLDFPGATEGCFSPACSTLQRAFAHTGLH